MTDPTDFIRALFAEEYADVLDRYRNALFAALPDVPRAEIMWRFQFMLGATSYAIIGTDLLRSVTGWVIDEAEQQQSRTAAAAPDELPARGLARAAAAAAILLGPGNGESYCDRETRKCTRSFLRCSSWRFWPWSCWGCVPCGEPCCRPRSSTCTARCPQMSAERDALGSRHRMVGRRAVPRPSRLEPHAYPAPAPVRR